MTKEEKMNLIKAHRSAMVLMFRELGYCCKMIENLNIVFYGGSPTQKQFDDVNYAAFLMVRDQERKRGHEIEILDLVG